jgi:hypothetical protein
MRVASVERLNIKVPVRIEEVQIGLTADGEEAVAMSVRAEEAETFITAATRDAPDPQAAPALAGRTVAHHRLKPWDDLAAVMRNVNTRLGRQERSPSA